MKLSIFGNFYLCRIPAIHPITSPPSPPLLKERGTGVRLIKKKFENELPRRRAAGYLRELFLFAASGGELTPKEIRLGLKFIF